ncbi:MAG: hypothetical protein HZA93_23880 [Verrucomicrobia bacterium]|nr:hypothetical protein [Verrucomicrobiota bacterium]
MPTYYTKAEADALFLHAGEDSASVKRDLTPLAAADESKAIAFASVFAAKPRQVVATVRSPSGGDNIFAVVDDALTTSAGFTARFTAPIPGAGYHLDWLAIL